MKRPVARKVLPDRHIYRSRQMPLSTGFPVLCDLDQARIGCEKQHGDIMPGIYRAPEVILGMEWNEKVDIWAVGMTVSFSFSLRDFNTRDLPVSLLYKLIKETHRCNLY